MGVVLSYLGDRFFNALNKCCTYHSLLLFTYCTARTHHNVCLSPELPILTSQPYNVPTPELPILTSQPYNVPIPRVTHPHFTAPTLHTMCAQSYPSSLHSPDSPELIYSILCTCDGHPSYWSIHLSVAEHTLTDIQCVMRVQCCPLTLGLQLIPSKSLSVSSIHLVYVLRPSTHLDSGCKLAGEPAKSPQSFDLQSTCYNC